MKKIIIISIVLIATFYLFTKFNSKIDSSDNNSLINFQSQNIDLSFTYPKSYGQANETVSTVESSDGLVSSGQSIKITFENNQEIYFILATKDYQSFKEFNFKGDKPISEYCQETVVDSYGNSCRIINIKNWDWLEKTQFFADEGIFNLIHIYYLPLNNVDNYDGMTVVQSFTDFYVELNKDISDDERIGLSERYSRDIFIDDSAENIHNQIDEIIAILETITI